MKGVPVLDLPSLESLLLVQRPTKASTCEYRRVSLDHGFKVHQNAGVNAELLMQRQKYWMPREWFIRGTSPAFDGPPSK